MPDAQQENSTPTSSEVPTSPAFSNIGSKDGDDSDVEAIERHKRGNMQGAQNLKVVTDTKGQISQQPIIPDSETEPFEGSFDEHLVPEIQDLTAPRSVVGVHDLSQAAIRSRTQRIFRRRSDGTKKVSEEVWADWFSKGKKKRVLEDIFKQCGYDPETCLRGCLALELIGHTQPCLELRRPSWPKWIS